MHNVERQRTSKTLVIYCSRYATLSVYCCLSVVTRCTPLPMSYRASATVSVSTIIYYTADTAVGYYRLNECVDVHDVIGIPSVVC